MLDTIIINITTKPPVITINTMFKISGSKGGSVGVVGVVGVVVGVGVGVGVVRITSMDSTLLH